MERAEPRRLWAAVGVALSIALAVACSGGFSSSGGSGGVADSGGMSGSGVTSGFSEGPISAFGSIFVNGVEWDLSDAAVELDGRPGDEADLRVGMVVRVRGEREGDARGTADSVVFDDAVEGPIAEDPVAEGPDGTRKRFAVLGTSVVVDADDTVFGGGASFDALARDQVVEVSGFVDDVGTLRATRVSLVGEFPGLDRVELRGTVANLAIDGPGGGIFDVGDVTVRYTAATVFDDGDADDLVNGVLVEVEGTLRASGDEVDATNIEREDDGPGDEDFDDFEVEGFVAAYVSDADFRVGRFPVDASAAEFDPPSLVLANGVLVEVEGRLVRGVLVASEVEGEGDDDPDDADDARRVEIEAAVGARSDEPRTLTLLGVVVTVDADTQLEDGRDDVENFRFGDIEVGDRVALEAVETGVGAARALEIEREESGADVVLRGPVTALDRDVPMLEVAGQPIPVGGATLYVDDGGVVGQSAFFSDVDGVRIGDVVRVVDVDAAAEAVLLEADEVERLDAGDD